MGEQTIPTIVRAMANHWVISGISYAPHQFQACEAPFLRLIGDSRPQQALAILTSLQQQALRKGNPWDWVTAEHSLKRMRSRWILENV